MTREEDLLRFEELWDQAFITNDYGQISRFMSEDWVIVGTSG